MKEFIELPKLSEGDQVAVISPSAGLPGLFPWVFEVGIEQLKSVFGLVPKEYPTTRQMGAPLQDRARDVMAAFSDPANKAVFTSIGGEDQIKLLKYLDPDVLKANPKPFFGFSDNTHLHCYLWQLGVPTYYGGAIMTQFAMQGGMHEMTVRYLKQALFENGEIELNHSDIYNDEGLDWADKKSLNGTRKIEPNEPWSWDGQTDASGRLWGGCVESLVAQVAANKFLPADEEIDGTVLFLETAEDIPDHWIVEYLLAGFGERGWLNRFQAVLVGRPKAWDFGKPQSADEKAKYRERQREAVLQAVREYNPTIPVIQNLDFGHTDPQVCLPNGRPVRIDSRAHKIVLTY